MSADNGIYILKTPAKDKGFEYRIRHLMAVENVMWNENTGQFSSNAKVQIANARVMWKDCDVIFSEEAAVTEAHRKAKRYPVLEYGVQFIAIDEPFQEVDE